MTSSSRHVTGVFSDPKLYVFRARQFGRFFPCLEASRGASVVDGLFKAYTQCFRGLHGSAGYGSRTPSMCLSVILRA